MSRPILILAGVVAVASAVTIMALPDAPPPRMLCTNLDEPLITIPVERDGTGYIWRDRSGFGRRITAAESERWHCRLETSR